VKKDHFLIYEGRERRVCVCACERYEIISYSLFPVVYFNVYKFDPFDDDWLSPIIIYFICHRKIKEKEQMFYELSIKYTRFNNYFHFLMYVNISL